MTIIRGNPRDLDEKPFPVPFRSAAAVTVYVTARDGAREPYV
jgi:hypothetical protein